MLKDWKKIPKNSVKRIHYDSEIQYNKKNSKNFVEINKIVLYDGTISWEFSNYKQEEKDFKTKSQALKYAKQYMKTH